MDTYLIRHYSSSRHGELVDSADGFDTAMDLVHKRTRNDEAVSVWTREGKLVDIFLPKEHADCVAWSDMPQMPNCMTDENLAQFYATHPAD